MAPSWLKGVFISAIMSLTLVSLPSWAEFQVPKLTGRILDQAQLIDGATQQRINKLLAGHEQASSNQIVVATFKDLQGYSIEQAGVDMGRAWGVGQKEADNGIVLILAKKERKVRIEVGYGLEGIMTDAVSASIVQQIMLPMFKKGDFSGGLLAGTEAIVVALGGQYVAPSGANNSESTRALPGLIFLFILLGIALNRRGRPGAGISPLMLLLLAGGGRGGSSGSGGSFGGFSGGGGGFGGGGASGGW
ncbi:MAG: TPM domain-containing protein [Oceanospirillaceae bacterium]|jgi:uncharacterized protein|nr:TPM domain-containing protein [Oceanospirillaceae bacterium]MBT4443164.1 TPM domain-containing protein [Oceanospirillaceae bacterium]MBT6078552.1 TPM domain-containing protein [Oceanospirillaceae bacterium]